MIATPDAFPELGEPEPLPAFEQPEFQPVFEATDPLPIYDEATGASYESQEALPDYGAQVAGAPPPSAPKNIVDRVKEISQNRKVVIIAAAAFLVLCCCCSLLFGAIWVLDENVGIFNSLGGFVNLEFTMKGIVANLPH
jgi:hypothetical protein